MPPLRARLIAVMAPVVALVAATLAAPTPAAADGVPGAFTLSGSGFGHGVGLSQYGAYAMAQEGKDAATIGAGRARLSAPSFAAASELAATQAPASRQAAASAATVSGWASR